MKSLSTLAICLLLIAPVGIQHSYAEKVKYILPYTQSGYAEATINTTSEEQIKRKLKIILADSNFFMVKDEPQLVFESDRANMGFWLSMATSMTKSSLVQQFGNNKRLTRLSFILIADGDEKTRVVARAYNVANPGTSIENAYDCSKKPEFMRFLFHVLNDLRGSLNSNQVTRPASEVIVP